MVVVLNRRMPAGRAVDVVVIRMSIVRHDFFFLLSNNGTAWGSPA
jgi:hypothetical protein